MLLLIEGGGGYLTRIQTVITQSVAMSRWSQCENTGQSSPAPDSLCSPRNIRRRESDEESPRKSRCRTRRAHSPRVEDVPAVVLSPVAVSARDPDAIIYDCRPPILPVSIKLKGLHQNNVVVSDVFPSLAAPSGEVGLQCGASLPERDAEPALMSGLSSDAGTDLEDKLCRFQPLPETLSPLSDSSVGNLPMSPSRYPAMAVPELDRPLP